MRNIPERFEGKTANKQKKESGKKMEFRMFDKICLMVLLGLIILGCISSYYENEKFYKKIESWGGNRKDCDFRTTIDFMGVTAICQLSNGTSVSETFW